MQKLLLKAQTIRQQIRCGDFVNNTSGVLPGLVQGNVVILTKEWAQDFLTFCENNPISCPLIAVSEVGDASLPGLGDDIDIRTDVPGYSVYRDGELVESRSEINDLWQPDMVAFVLGCSFSFEEALIKAGISVRNIDMGVNVSMYETSIQTLASAKFHGNLVVSMRPFNAQDTIKAIQITSRFPKVHGAPIHLGDPSLIGIKNIYEPEYGCPVEIKSNEIPVFWGCGVTPQVAIRNAKPPICITHVPGKMLITDKRNADYEVH
ncbi:MAG: putative hydro-lyase [Arenicella sp.]